jgi:ABC-type polysaccharide/polyol phosphate export permease
MTGVVQLYRTALLGGELAWSSTLVVTLEAVLVFVLGWITFRRMEPGFVDEI